MKEKLTQYIDLLFAGAGGCEDIKQEILQNTLDRYDDLIAEGKVPEAAYRLAITGIGDINEILGTAPTPREAPASAPASPGSEEDTPKKKRMRGIAVALYILCPVPLLILANLGDFFAVLGICCLLAMVAIATYLMMVNSPKDQEEKQETGSRKSVRSAVSAVALVVYFLISFTTQDWHITWLVFPIAAAVRNLIFAILDLMEGKDYEN